MCASCLITFKFLFFFFKIEILLSISIGLSNPITPLTIETKASEASFSEISFAISAEVTGFILFFIFVGA